MTPLGIVRYFNLLELLKALSGIDVTPDPIDRTSILLLKKASAVIVVTEFGITSFVKLVATKARLPIVIRPSLRVTDVRPPIAANAKVSSVVTLPGITNV